MRVPTPLHKLVLLALLAVPVACTDSSTEVRDAVATPADAVVVASFNFPESVLLGEIYSQALQAAGIPVRRELDLGPRELVEPALEQGRVDVVPEYLGTALGAIDPTARVDVTDTDAVRLALARALAPLRLHVLEPADAQDQNGFAITSEAAGRLGVRTLSQLARVQRSVTLAGPFECRTRAYCLPGLERVYDLEVTRFLAYDSEAQRVAALDQGLVDVAVLFTTDGRLATGEIVLLDDDRGLQPAENVVPVVSGRARAAHGSALDSALNAVSARLTTRGLVFLNWRVSVAGKDPAAEAEAWLRRHGLLTPGAARTHGGPAA